jgi:signal transduction histidine kinase
MPGTVRDEVYLIGFEAIRNACVHSGGERLDVDVAYGPDLTIRVADNGRGIDPATIDGGREGHFGLQTMRERALRIGAMLTIGTGKHGGTEIVLIVPGQSLFPSQPTTT